MPSSSGPLAPVSRLAGLRCLVTGATGGIGSVLCKTLVERGAHVVATCRSHERLRELQDRLGDDRVSIVVADLASLAEVAALPAAAGPIDVLVANAGVGFGRDQMQREVSHDGFELRFAVNYLAPFVLTHALIAKASAVVQVASAGQRELDFDDLQSERDYDGIVAYRRSKLAQVMLAFDLAASQRTPITALHPGTFLDTGMVRESGITPLGTAAEGAEAVLTIIERTLAGATGQFFDRILPARADGSAYDAVVRRRLRERTLALVGPWLIGEG